MTVRLHTAVRLADITTREISTRVFSQVSVFKPSGFLEELSVFSVGAICEYLWISDLENPNFLGIGMWQAVTLDFKFTSLSPVQNIHWCVLCYKHLFLFDSSEIQQLIDWSVKNKCCAALHCMQGVHLIFGFTSFPSSLDDHQAWKLVDLVFYLNWCISSMDDACMPHAHAHSVHKPMQERLSILLRNMPRACCAHTHTQQQMRQAALHIPCATVN